MKKINFMPQNIRELLQLLEVVQRQTAHIPELYAQTTQLIAIVKSMGRWMVCMDASRHAIIITWLTTFACIVFEKYGAPRIEPYSIPAILAMVGGSFYSLKKLKKQADNLVQANEKFKNTSHVIIDMLNYLSDLQNQK